MSASRGRLAEIAGLFTRLGFTAFGGPAAHIALMEDEVVRRRGWVDRQHFLDLVSSLNFIPGPNSTELAIHLGQIRGGWRGLIVAGACFIIPAMLIILPLAWAYHTYGRLPQVAGVMRGISAAVVAMILLAGLRLARTSIRDGFTIVIAVLAAPVQYMLATRTRLQPEIVILAAAAVAGIVWYGVTRVTRQEPGNAAGANASSKENEHTAKPKDASGQRLVSIAAPIAWPAASLGFLAPEFARMAWFFLKVGATLFGSGYVLVSYLRSGLVEQNGWLSSQQLIDAVSVGQVTPGPLLTTSTFIGYLLGTKWTGTIAGGVAGGVIATVAIFLPAFLLVALFGRVLPRLRQNRHARAALDGMNAAVVALILVVAVQFALKFQTQGGTVDWFQVAVAGAALTVLLAWNLNATWIIAAAGVAGWLAG